MSNQQTASDRLKHATYLWRTERNEQYARSILDDLLIRYPDSEEAAAASNLLEEINSAAVSEEGLAGNVSSKLKTASHVAAVIVALAGIGLMMFGKNLIDSAPTGDGGIYGLFGVLIILAGGLMTIGVAISWILNAVVQVISWTFRTVAQQFGIKGIVVLVSIVLAAGYLVLYSFPNISGG
jgi:hypothetical protein